MSARRAGIVHGNAQRKRLCQNFQHCLFFHPGPWQRHVVQNEEMDDRSALAPEVFCAPGTMPRVHRACLTCRPCLPMARHGRIRNRNCHVPINDQLPVTAEVWWWPTSRDFCGLSVDSIVMSGVPERTERAPAGSLCDRSDGLFTVQQRFRFLRFTADILGNHIGEDATLRQSI